MKHPLSFYRCAHCGNVAYKMFDAGVGLVCCGEDMQELLPGTVDAALEKHVPVVEVKDGKASVQVGSVLHPMLPEHYIGFVVLENENSFEARLLNPGEEPTAVFAVGEDKPVAVYEWCNLHGLWKTEV